SRRRHTRSKRDWSSDVCSSDLAVAADPSLMSLSTWATILQMIGWLSVPVFAFLLVEGFQHTSSFKRYLLTMLGFAVVSEIPYDQIGRASCREGVWSAGGDGD